MKVKDIPHTLKIILGILCTVSFLSGCIATQEVKVNDDPNKSSKEGLPNGEIPPPSRPQFQPVTQLQARKTRQSNTQDQSKDQLQLMYMDYLKKEGYFPKTDSDGDIIFKKEGKLYFIDIRAQQSDPRYFRIVHPSFWSIDNEIERRNVLEVADHINSTRKVMKVYTVEDNTWASIGIFVSNQEDFKVHFSRIMSNLSGGIELFIKEIREVRKQRI